MTNSVIQKFLFVIFIGITVSARALEDDPSVTGSSTITDYDINTNGILFAEQVQNLT